MKDCEIEIQLSAGRRHILFWPGPDFPLPREWNGNHGSGEAMRLGADGRSSTGGQDPIHEAHHLLAKCDRILQDRFCDV